MLRSDEPGLKNEEVSYRLPRKARVCPEGMEGVWQDSAMTVDGKSRASLQHLFLCYTSVPL